MSSNYVTDKLSPKLLVERKIELSKQLGQIDRELANIEIALQSGLKIYKNPLENCRLNDQVLQDSEVPKWWAQYNKQTHYVFLDSDITVYPTQYDRALELMQVMKTKTWQRPQVFRLPDTHLYNIILTGMSYKLLYIEYSVADACGFFTYFDDIKVVMYDDL